MIWLDCLAQNRCWLALLDENKRRQVGGQHVKLVEVPVDGACGVGEGEVERWPGRMTIEGRWEECVGVG